MTSGPNGRCAFRNFAVGSSFLSKGNDRNRLAPLGHRSKNSSRVETTAELHSHSVIQAASPGNGLYEAIAQFVGNFIYVNGPRPHLNCIPPPVSLDRAAPTV